MLSTQLTGLFQRITEHEKTLEEIARLLAQAAVGEGTIFIAAFGEMKAVTAAAIYGAEPLTAAREWKPDSLVTGTDRVFILAKKDEGDGTGRQTVGCRHPVCHAVRRIARQRFA